MTYDTEKYRQEILGGVWAVEPDFEPTNERSGGDISKTVWDFEGPLNKGKLIVKSKLNGIQGHVNIDLTYKKGKTRNTIQTSSDIINGNIQEAVYNALLALQKKKR
jgi:hypothetical protein